MKGRGFEKCWQWLTKGGWGAWTPNFGWHIALLLSGATDRGVVGGVDVNVGEEEGRVRELCILPWQPQLVAAIPGQGVQVLKKCRLLYVFFNKGVKCGKCDFVPFVDETSRAHFKAVYTAAITCLWQMKHTSGPSQGSSDQCSQWGVQSVQRCGLSSCGCPK